MVEVQGMQTREEGVRWGYSCEMRKSIFFDVALASHLRKHYSGDHTWPSSCPDLVDAILMVGAYIMLLIPACER